MAIAKRKQHLSLVPPAPIKLAPRPPAVSPDEAARMIGLGRTTFLALLRDGEIPFIRVSVRRRKILVSDLEAWLAKQEKVVGL